MRIMSWPSGRSWTVPNDAAEERISPPLRSIFAPFNRKPIRFESGVMVNDPAGAEHWMSIGYRALAFGADFRLYADALKSGIDAVRRM